MAVSFSKTFVESVRDAGDIAQVIADYVQLKGAGSRLKGLCPFHQEKTPSFSVDTERQMFYCFGCQTGGDVFKFVQLYEGVSFPESVEWLASRFGLALPDRTESSKEDPVQIIRQLNELATQYFQKILSDPEAGTKARAYLDQRGLTSETIERLGIGASVDSWDGLTQHLQSKRVHAKALVDAGLALPRKSGNGIYDRFRDRLIFPIRDVYGRTVAFGGRTLGDDVAKYLNSPETAAYIKGDHLYGLDAAKDSIRRRGYAVVVEGYMDAAAMIQAGFDHVVATCGTAFSEKQARLLARFTQRVVLAYDGDEAGAGAVTRSVELLLDQGFHVSVLPLPDGQDPDDFIQSQGAETMGRLLGHAPPWIQFLVEREAKSKDLSNPAAKTEVLEAVLPHILRLPNAVERADWAGKVADWIGVEDRWVRQELERALDQNSAQLRMKAPSVKKPREGMGNVTPLEARLVRLCADDHGAREAVRESWDACGLAELPTRHLLEAMIEFDRGEQRFDARAVLDSLKEEKDQILFSKLVMEDEPSEGPTVSDCLWALQRRYLEVQGRRETRRLARQQQRPGMDRGTGGNEESVDEMLRRVQELAKARDALTEG